MYRDTDVKVRDLLDVNVPEDIRNDLFRALNLLVVNAIRTSNLSLNLEKEDGDEKEDRFVEVSCKEKGPDDAPSSAIEIIVEDNGNGIGNLGALGKDYNSWLSRLRRIAARRGWAFQFHTTKGEGAKAFLRIEIEEEGGDTSTTGGQRSTLQGMGPSTATAYGGVIEEPSVCADESQPSEVSGDVEGIVPEETASVDSSTALAAVAALGGGVRKPSG